MSPRTVVSLPIDLVNKSYVAYLKADSAADDLVSFFTRVNNTLYRNRKARMSARTYFGVNTAADQTAGLVGNDTRSPASSRCPSMSRPTVATRVSPMR